MTKIRYKSKCVGLALIFILIATMIIGASLYIGNVFAEEESIYGDYVGRAGGMVASEIDGIINKPTNGAPTITILTHGQGGSANSWSNNIGSGDGKQFLYDEQSIIELIRAKVPNIQLYLAQAILNIANVPEEGTYDGDLEKQLKQNELNKEQENHTENREYKCVPLVIQNGEYIKFYEEKKQGNINIGKSIKQIQNADVQSLIIYESSQLMQYGTHEKSYEELEYFIDRIVYDYYMINGVVPKINLIGHSRGGLLNMMYASRHPYIINAISSIGTPYWGSNIALLAQVFNFKQSSSHALSTLDINDSNKQNQIHTEWENALKVNPNIVAAAYGGVMDLVFALKVINQEYCKNNDALSQVLDILTDGIIVLEGLYLDTPLTHINAELTKQIKKANAEAFKNDENFFGLLIGMLNNVTLSRELRFTLFNSWDIYGYNFIYNDDGCVSYESQVADGYSHFEREIKIYNEFNSDFTKRSVASAPIAHNLEARDVDLIVPLVNRMFNNDYAFNISKLKDGTVRIDGINKTHINADTFQIPKTFDGKLISQIGDNAFINNFDGLNITSVFIPKTVKKIGKNAFAGCTNLTSIIFEEGSLLTNVDYGAFANCGIETITLPNMVDSLSSAIFANCKNLKTFNAGNNIYRIMESAFENCEKLQSVNFNEDSNLTHIDSFAFKNCNALISINLPKLVQKVNAQSFLTCNNLTDINVSPGNTMYSSSDGVLYSKHNKILICYPLGKTNTSFKMPNSVTTVGQYAFIRSKLSTISLSENLSVIGNFAFYENINLNNISILPNITLIEPMAFFNCSNLNSVAIYTSNPNALCYGAFDNIGANVQFYLPYKSIKKEYDINNQNLALGYYDSYYETEQYKTRLNPITYNLIIDENNGASETTRNMNYLDVFNYVPEKEGHVFVGWYTSEENNNGNGEVFQSNALKQHNSNINIYAKWRPKQFKVEICYETSTSVKSKYVTNGGLSDVEVGIYYGDKVDMMKIWDWYLSLVQSSDGQKLVGFKSVVKSFNGQSIVAPSGNNYDYKEIFKKFDANLMASLPDYGDDNSYIVIVPEFENKKVVINFNSNGGNNIASINKICGSTISLPVPQKAGYEFKYWKVSKLEPTSTLNNNMYLGKQYNFAQVPDFAHNIPLDANVTLDAVWGNYIIDAYNFSSNEINGKEMITLDFYEYSQNMIADRMLNIGNIVKELTIKNCNNLKRLSFKVQGDLQLTLINSSFTGMDGQAGIDASDKNLTIYCTGANFVSGGRRLQNSNASGTGIIARNITINYGQDSSQSNNSTYLYALGGTGKDGAQLRTAPLSGGHGIYAATLQVNVTLTAIGGDGGIGYNGSPGVSVGVGANGGNGIYVTGTISSKNDSEINAIGGSGGDGGIGAKGITGSTGADGKFLVPAKKGGRGGTGETGGRGGNGAAGVNSSATISCTISQTGGVGGYGGEGGEGGDGGRGGKKLNSTNYAATGDKGAQGSPGADGNDA